MSTPTDLIIELTGHVCACGGKKSRGRTFCVWCYRSLSEDRQRALYRHIGKGYEEAYATAKVILQQNGRIRPLQKKAAASQGSMFDMSPYPE